MEDGFFLSDEWLPSYEIFEKEKEATDEIDLVKKDMFLENMFPNEEATKTHSVIANVVNDVLQSSSSKILQKFTVPSFKDTKEEVLHTLYPLKKYSNKIETKEKSVEFPFDKTRKLYSNLCSINGCIFLHPCNIIGFLTSDPYINFINKHVKKNSVYFYCIIGLEICYGMIPFNISDCFYRILSPYCIGTSATMFVFEGESVLYRVYTLFLCENSIKFTYTKEKKDISEIEIQKEKKPERKRKKNGDRTN